MEIVTFSHFSDVSWVGVSFMMSSTTTRTAWLSDSMAAVFSYPRSLAVGAEYEILQFLVVERTLLTLCSTV